MSDEYTCGKGHTGKPAIKKADGFRRCMECNRIAARRHYEKHREKIRPLRRKREIENREFIKELKNVPCTDCGVKYPTYVMHFDHINPAEKTCNISEFRGQSKETILKEVAKCDVVCANCHAERTYGSRQAKSHDCTNAETKAYERGLKDGRLEPTRKADFTPDELKEYNRRAKQRSRQLEGKE